MKRLICALAVVALLGASVILVDSHPAVAAEVVVRADCSERGEMPVTVAQGDVLRLAYKGCGTLELNGSESSGSLELVDALPPTDVGKSYLRAYSLPESTGTVALRVTRTPSQGELYELLAFLYAPGVAPGDVLPSDVTLVAQRTHGWKVFDTTGVTAQFVRSKANCDAGVLTLHGIDPSQRMRAHFYETRRGFGGAFDGWKGGSGSDWSRYFDLSKPGWNTDDGKTGQTRLPRGPFKMQIDVRWPGNHQSYTTTQRIPACNR